MALLQALKGLSPGQQFPLTEERSILGRHPDCEIVLDVGAVSRQHAQIIRVGNEFFVEDLKSRNGTYVNGVAIQGRQRLEENDRVKICDLLFTFHHDQPGTNIEDGSAMRLTLPRGVSMLDDSELAASSTVMSKVDISSSREGMRVTVNPEIKLKALLAISRNLGSAISLDKVLPKLLDSLFTIFVQADRGFIVLQQGDDAALVPKAVKHRRANDDQTVRISRTIVKQVMASKEAILSADAASDARFDTSQSIADFRIRSMMCAPLVASSGRALGVMQIDTMDQRSRFQPDDLEVLAAVASQAAFAVENAELHETELKRQALDYDLEMAHKVQQGFLPSSPPKIEGYEFFDFYEPANQVGGDYFDYVPLSGNRIAVVTADVSGKGMPAALLMAKLSAETRYCLASEESPALAIRRLNSTFMRYGWEDRFVTMALCVLDCDKHELTLVNAGHMPPFLHTKAGEVISLGDEITGVPLGVDDTFQYEQVKRKIAPGDSLVVFTDGISEAMNMGNELYGMSRIADQLIYQDIQTMDVLGKRLLRDVKQFVGDRAQSDDMCLLCFGRTA